MTDYYHLSASSIPRFSPVIFRLDDLDVSAAVCHLAWARWAALV
jgi:hypothetical protein